MGFLEPKPSFLVFIIISVTLLSVSVADAHRKFIDQVEDGGMLKESDNEQASHAHSRILAVKTNDYGTYDPSPAFVKPPYKLIPN